MKTYKEFISLVAEGQWSGNVNLRYGSKPATATNQSVSGAVNKALANPGVSQSASEIKGKTGITGSGSLQYSGTLGTKPKPVENQNLSTSTKPTKVDKNIVTVKPLDSKSIKPIKPVDSKSIKPIKPVDSKSIKPIKPVDSKPIKTVDIKKSEVNTSISNNSNQTPQNIRDVVAAIRDASPTEKGHRLHQADLGPTRNKNGNVLSGAERIRRTGIFDALRAASNSAR